MQRRGKGTSVDYICFAARVTQRLLTLLPSNAGSTCEEVEAFIQSSSSSGILLWGKQRFNSVASVCQPCSLCKSTGESSSILCQYLQWAGGGGGETICTLALPIYLYLVVFSCTTHPFSVYLEELHARLVLVTLVERIFVCILDWTLIGWCSVHVPYLVCAFCDFRMLVMLLT